MSRFFGSPASYRRVTIVAVILGAVVALDLVLFGWLIFRSLSEREIESVLLETRKSAREIAGSIEGRARSTGHDLWTVVTTERRIRDAIDSTFSGSGYVREVKVFDHERRLVLQNSTFLPSTPPGEPGLDAPSWDLGGGEIPPPSSIDGPDADPATDPDTATAEDGDKVHTVEVPIGELGSVLITLSPEGLDERIADLRSNLISQTVTIGLVTTALLVAAAVLIGWFWRRGRILEAEKAESERLAYIGTLASGLAHEIRNPLNSLNLNVQMLEEDLREKGELEGNHKLIGITRSELKRLDRLVTDFLSYARPRPLDRVEVRAVDLLVSAGEQLVGEANTLRTALEVEDRSGGATVQVDAGQMRQLLLNLIQNAFAAVEATGRPARVVLAAERRGSNVDLLVEDNGTGVPPEDRDRIFEIFYSTKKGGTGLGLAIVQRIAQNHGGTIAIEANPSGVGTTVRVSLPAATPSREATGTIPLPVAAARA